MRHERRSEARSAPPLMLDDEHTQQTMATVAADYCTAAECKWTPILAGEVMVGPHLQGQPTYKEGRRPRAMAPSTSSTIASEGDRGPNNSEAAALTSERRNRGPQEAEAHGIFTLGTPRLSLGHTSIGGPFGAKERRKCGRR